MQSELVQIPLEQVSTVWPLAEPWLKTLPEGTEYPLEHFKKEIHAGRFHLWFVVTDDTIDAVVVTAFIDGRCLFTACAGKDMRRWLHLRHEIEAWAEANGCKGSRFYGRPGWKAMLPDYKVTRLIMDKDF